MKKILLDTDIGSDIDDSVCLAYLLSQPECDLLGITTVSGESVNRAKIASVLCHAAGKNIPIFPGAEEPLYGPQRQPRAPQVEALGSWACDSNFPRGEAIEFLRRTIRQNPGEVTLLAIGPMTNVALLFRTDPEIPSLLRELVLMCGVFTNRLAGVGPMEWNALCDPVATAAVYGAPVKIHRSVGLDVTCRVTLPKNEVLRRFTAPVLKPVLDIAGQWFRAVPVVTFHDPLAAVSAFEPDICRFERGRVDVSISCGRTDGMTFWNPGPDGPHQVALDVDPALFFRKYFSVVK